MTINEYQELAESFAIKIKDNQTDATIMALGITGEAGEVADKWKKILVYNKGKITEEDRDELAKEIGDTLWYLATFAKRLDLSLEEIADNNIKKLSDRTKRGVIRGKGDNR